MKNALAASRSSTTMRTLSIRLTVTFARTRGGPLRLPTFDCVLYPSCHAGLAHSASQHHRELCNLAGHHIDGSNPAIRARRLTAQGRLLGDGLGSVIILAGQARRARLELHE